MLLRISLGLVANASLIFPIVSENAGEKLELYLFIFELASKFFDIKGALLENFGDKNTLILLGRTTFAAMIENTLAKARGIYSKTAGQISFEP